MWEQMPRQQAMQWGEPGRGGDTGPGAGIGGGYDTGQGRDSPNVGGEGANPSERAAQGRGGADPSMEHGGAFPGMQDTGLSLVDAVRSWGRHQHDTRREQTKRVRDTIGAIPGSVGALVSGLTQLGDWADDMAYGRFEKSVADDPLGAYEDYRTRGGGGGRGEGGSEGAMERRTRPQEPDGGTDDADPEAEAPWWETLFSDPGPIAPRTAGAGGGGSRAAASTPLNPGIPSFISGGLTDVLASRDALGRL